jgi:GNAT superfamily N-acetyltransferase
VWATRRATDDDHAAVLQLFAELGVPDPPPDAAGFAQHMLPRLLVACGDGGEVVGYAHWRIYGRTAHVVHLVAAPHVRGRGLGRALMDAVREAVAAEGCTRWYLNVKRDNAPARRLYEQCGMAIERDLWVLKIGWAQLDALAGDGAAAAAYAPGADEDAEIAARFALERERLASLRARPGTKVIALRGGGGGGGGEIAAYAAFDPQFPSAAVFCASEVSLARPLLDACQAHADLARFDFVRLVVDSDRALVAALVAAGAEITFEILQMGGVLAG